MVSHNCCCPLIMKSETLTCSKGLFVLMPFPPQKTQLSLKPRWVIDVLPNSAISRRASSLSLEEEKKNDTVNVVYCMWSKEYWYTLITAHTSDSWCYRITLQTGLRHRWRPLTLTAMAEPCPAPQPWYSRTCSMERQGPVNSLFWAVGLRMADLETIFWCVGAGVGWRCQGLVHAPFFPVNLHTSDIFISWFLPHSNDSHTLLRTQTPPLSTQDSPFLVKK